MAIEAYFHPYFDQVNPNMIHSNSNLYAAAKYHQPPPTVLPHVVFDQQNNQQIHHFLRSQNEKLRIFMQEQRKQEVETLLKKIELNVFYMLNQKEERISEATKKRLELEEFLTRLEIENQTWRRAAHENEAMVLSLHNALEQMKQRVCYYSNNDVESCCDIRNHEEEEETGENRVCGDDEQITSLNMICKCCGSHESSFMFLPCRHLCSCKACEPSLQACPVCLGPKTSIIETLIF